MSNKKITLSKNLVQKLIGIASDGIDLAQEYAGGESESADEFLKQLKKVNKIITKENGGKELVWVE
ncbi:MAG: hypothetical protein WC119_00905 [Synergistaceae bacterium]